MKRIITTITALIFTGGLALFIMILIILFYQNKNILLLILGILVAFIIPFSWIIAKKVGDSIFGEDIHQIKLDQLKKELEAREKSIELEAKIEAQENIKGFHREIKKNLKS